MDPIEKLKAAAEKAESLSAVGRTEIRLFLGSNGVEVAGRSLDSFGGTKQSLSLLVSWNEVLHGQFNRAHSAVVDAYETITRGG